MPSLARPGSFAALLVPALLAACATRGADPAAGVTEEKIVNGMEATTMQLFSTVGITPGMSICTGSVVAPQVILTAAHCVANDDGTPSVTPAETTVYAGALQIDNATPEQQFTVRKIVAHAMYRGISNLPNPDANGLSKAYDIAILLLDKPITTLPVVPILPLDMLDASATAGTMLTITGYGNSDAASTNGAGTLRIAQTPYQARNATEFFAGSTGLPDTCQGDSGGPQYLDVGGTKYQIGETSRGGGSSACGEGGVYTIAGAYVDWITTNSEGLYTGGAGGSDAGGAGGSHTGGAGGASAGGAGGMGGGSTDDLGGSGGSDEPAPGKKGGCTTAPGSNDGAFTPIALTIAAFVARRRRARA
jgi:secreted trypsin-like serine protease